MNARLLLILLWVMIGAFYFPLRSHAEDLMIVPEVVEEEITGRIEKIDYDTDNILLKIYNDESLDSYEEENFYVLEEAVIEKNDKLITFRDLLPEEEIRVQYRVTDDGRKEVDHIWVKTKQE